MYAMGCVAQRAARGMLPISISSHRSPTPQMLDTNAQLIKLCVELQNSPWPTAKQELVK